MAEQTEGIWVKVGRTYDFSDQNDGRGEIKVKIVRIDYADSIIIRAPGFSTSISGAAATCQVAWIVFKKDVELPKGGGPMLSPYLEQLPWFEFQRRVDKALTKGDE